MSSVVESVWSLALSRSNFTVRSPLSVPWLLEAKSKKHNILPWWNLLCETLLNNNLILKNYSLFACTLNIRNIYAMFLVLFMQFIHVTVKVKIFVWYPLVYYLKFHLTIFILLFKYIQYIVE